MKYYTITLLLFFISLQLIAQDITSKNLMDEHRIFGYANVIKMDYNNDGYMDIVAAGNSWYPMVIGLQLDTNGVVFQTDTLYHFGSGSGTGLNHADINKDGHMDILLTSTYTACRILTNDGQGNFSFYNEVPSSTEVGDIDNDGDLDLFVNNGGTISYLENIDGYGLNYGSPQPIPTVSSNGFLKVHDINQDGYAEIFTGSSIFMIWGEPDQSYDSTYSIGGTNVQFTDFVNDDTLDIVGVSQHGISRHKLIGDTVVFHKNYFGPYAFTSDRISFGHYDSTSTNIVLAAYHANPNSQAIYAPTTPYFVRYDKDDDDFTGGEDFFYNLASPTSDCGSYFSIDVNNNGIEEAVFGITYVSGTASKLFTESPHWAQEPDGHSLLEGIFTPSHSMVFDQNGDGLNDITISTLNLPEVKIFLGAGQEEFEAPYNFGNHYKKIFDFDYVDYDMDGSLDLVFCNANGLFVLYDSIHAVSLHAGNNNMVNLPGPVNSFTSGDFTSDGKIDFVIGDAHGNIILVENINADTASSDYYLLQSSGVNISQVESADYNNDSILDIFAMDSSGKLRIYQGNGNGTFLFNTEMDLPNANYSLQFELEDMNNDSYVDIVTTYKYWHKNDSLGGFEQQFQYGDWAGYEVTLFDFDNDGDMDIAGASNYGLTLFSNDSLASSFTSNTLTTAGYLFVGHGDLNNDGYNELLAGGSMQVHLYKFCFPTTDSVQVQACGSYEMMDGTIVTESGVYNDVFLSERGCDSIIAKTVEITTIDTSFTVMDATLTASDLEATYQWYDCDQEMVINGETGQSFTAMESGNYALILNNNSCTDTTSCTTIIITSMDDAISSSNTVSLYPNPTSSSINISLAEDSDSFTYIIYSMSGKVLLREETTSNRVNLTLPEQGSMFILEVVSENHLSRHRIVKE